MDTFTDNAADLFRIATSLAGFDKKELMLEIFRLQGRRMLYAKCNARTVGNAMDNIREGRA